MARFRAGTTAFTLMCVIAVLAGCASDRAAALRAAVTGTWKVDAGRTAPAITEEIGRVSGPMTEMLTSFLVSMAPPAMADTMQSGLTTAFRHAGRWLGNANVMRTLLSLADDQFIFEFAADGTFKVTSTLTGGNTLTGTWQADGKEDAVFVTLPDAGQFPERSRVTEDEDGRLRLITPADPGPLPLLVLILERT